MKLINKIGLSATLVALVASGCKQSEIPIYDNAHDAVRFAQKDDDNKEEKGYDVDARLFKASHSFIATPTLESHDYQLPIELIGLVADKDRTVAYKVDATSSTAPAGSYEIIGASIPAGKRSGKLTIRLKNSEALKVDEYKLYITLESSSDLAAGPRYYTRAELTWSQRIPTPQHPDLIATYNALIASDLQWDSRSTDCLSGSALRTIVEALKWYDWDDTKKHGSNANGSRYNNYKYLPRIETLISGNFHKGYALTLADYIKQYNEKNPDKKLIHDGGKLKGQEIKARTY